MPKFLAQKQNDGVAWVILDRTEKKNALVPEMLEEIRDAFLEIDRDQKLRVAVLTGGEDVFCAGFDLTFIRTLKKESNEDFTSLFHQAYRAIRFCRQPVIAAVGGPAIAGGFDLTLMCDIRYASGNAKFGQREIALSLTPLLEPLVQIIGLGRALEAALTGRIYGADEALAMGYVSKVFPKDMLLDEVGKIALTMAGFDKTCLEETKRLGRNIAGMDSDSAMKVSEWLFRSYLGAPDNHRRIDNLLAGLQKK